MEQPILPLGRMAFLSLWERPWGNPTHQDLTISLAMALLMGKVEGTNPAASKSLDTS